MAMLGRALILSAAACALPAQAIDYRSVEAPVAILYDVPSQKGKMLYLVKRQTPVELVVKLDGWVKVRDAEGTLAWIESKYLDERRTVVVIAPVAEVRQSDQPDAPVAFLADKWVALDFLEAASPGWVKVRHQDGVTGFVRTTQIWGL